MEVDQGPFDLYARGKARRLLLDARIAQQRIAISREVWPQYEPPVFLKEHSERFGSDRDGEAGSDMN